MIMNSKDFEIKIKEDARKSLGNDFFNQTRLTIKYIEHLHSRKRDLESILNEIKLEIKYYEEVIEENKKEKK